MKSMSPVPTMHVSVSNTIVQVMSGDLRTSKMPSGKSQDSRMAGKNLCETWELCQQTFSGRKEAKDPSSAAFTSNCAALRGVSEMPLLHSMTTSRGSLGPYYLLFTSSFISFWPFCSHFLSSFPNSLSKLLVELLSCKFDHVTS